MTGYALTLMRHEFPMKPVRPDELLIAGELPYGGPWAGSDGYAHDVPQPQLLSEFVAAGHDLCDFRIAWLQAGEGSVGVVLRRNAHACFLGPQATAGVIDFSHIVCRPAIL